MALTDTSQPNGGTLRADTLAMIQANATDPIFNTVSYSTANALTALAGGGQTGATAIAKGINRFTTVATAADSGLLTAAVAGKTVVVINAAAANSMNIFPATGDAINALSANAAYALAANKTVRFFCAVAGTWNTILTA